MQQAIDKATDKAKYIRELQRQLETRFGYTFCLHNIEADICSLINIKDIGVNQIDMHLSHLLSDEFLKYAYTCAEEYFDTLAGLTRYLDKQDKTQTIVVIDQLYYISTLFPELQKYMLISRSEFMFKISLQQQLQYTRLF